MDFSVVLAYLFGVVILYIIARLLLVPLTVISQLIINALVGGVMLAAFNLVGGFWGLYLAINPITALVAGLLGIPGLLLLAAVRIFLLD